MSKQNKKMNTKEQQFTEIIQEHERTIYTVCYMFSEKADEVNDLYQKFWSGCGEALIPSRGRATSGLGFIVSV